MIRTVYEQMRAGGAPDTDGELVVELVFDTPRAVPEVNATVSGLLPGAGVEVETAFGQAEDLYHFVRFPEITADRQEMTAFRLARELRAATGAREASPVLRDSFYGAVAAARSADLEGKALETAMLNCSTPDNQTYPTAWTHRTIGTAAA